MDSNNGRTNVRHGVGPRFHATGHGYGMADPAHNYYDFSLSNHWALRPLSQLHGPRRLKSTTEIKSLIVQECTRFNQDYFGFSLLIFNLVNVEASESVGIADVFPLERIRLTDFIGHFPENRLILILPRTSRMGARHLGAELVRLAFARNIQIIHENYSYPRDLAIMNQALQDYMPEMASVIPDESNDSPTPSRKDPQLRDKQSAPVRQLLPSHS